MAAYGSKPESSLFFFADSFLDARAVLEALHVGVDGGLEGVQQSGAARAKVEVLGVACDGGDHPLARQVLQSKHL